MKALIVTDKQLGVIQDACELYGRIQLGQFRGFAEIVTQVGFDGFGIRVEPKRRDDETDEEFKERREYLYRQDELTKECLEGAVEGIYRHAYHWKPKPRTNEADIALDIWAKLDGRREDTDFSMSTEPLVQVKEVTDENA